MSTQAFTVSHWPADRTRPVLDRTTGDLLREAAHVAPEQVALIEAVPAGAAPLLGATATDRQWTYSELLAEAEACAQWLLDHFNPGQRLAVWAPNIPEWVILQYGAAMAGLVLVTANPALREQELAYVMKQSGAVGLVYTPHFRGTDMTAIVRAVRAQTSLRSVLSFTDWNEVVRDRSGLAQPLPRVTPDDLAQIQYTSGTTGQPKGALLHHRGLVANALLMIERLGLPHQGTFLTAMPLFHTGGCAMSVLGAANARAALVLCQYFEPELLLAQIQTTRADALFGVPTMLIATLDHPRFTDFDLRSCRLVMSGGSGVASELVDRLEHHLNAKVSIIYGQTEAAPIICQTSPADPDEKRRTSIGRPLENVEVKIVDPVTGETLPVGEQGELCARGYQVMYGYNGIPEATAAAIDDEGWLHTGDLAVMDDSGYFTITGRLKDMIIRGGENIYPREIEDLLFAHPRVAEAVVVGIPDKTWGEQVAAVLSIVDKHDLPTAQELHDYCRATLAPHKTPKRWYFTTDGYPLTGSGKVMKYRVAEAISDGRYPALPSTEH